MGQEISVLPTQINQLLLAHMPNLHLFYSFMKISFKRKKQLSGVNGLNTTSDYKYMFFREDLKAIERKTVNRFR